MRQPSPEALKAAENFYLEIAAKARAAVEELNIDPSKYGAIFEELLDETSDRAVAITTYAIFDDVLLEIFQKHLNPDVPGSLNSILNPSAFLGTSHNRAKLALALRWIGTEVYHDVDILRNVRNRFAHHVSVKSFQHEPIAGYVSSLETLPLAKKALNTTKKRDQFIFRSIGCFNGVLENSNECRN
jgi:DNA-binding MltR family transcriptional regulator